ncbi:MAG: hypothetical protein EOR16_23460 [Mesorhizobium sp.]|uniref:hypothetical protein n=1 Tax=Mesorhizobium sp. TaxID=1871066 RepID=UPI000FE90B83|nr:hypothetical protein [Mesorhizobium sp.]RWI54746.1 MAG: hypothetical protein EOR16_23460 [Mesorhizobium sp.]
MIAALRKFGSLQNDHEAEYDKGECQSKNEAVAGGSDRDMRRLVHGQAVSDRGAGDFEHVLFDLIHVAEGLIEAFAVATIGAIWFSKMPRTLRSRSISFCLRKRPTYSRARSCSTLTPSKGLPAPAKDLATSLIAQTMGLAIQRSIDREAVTPSQWGASIELQLRSLLAVRAIADAAVRVFEP